MCAIEMDLTPRETSPHLEALQQALSTGASDRLALLTEAVAKAPPAEVARLLLDCHERLEATRQELARQEDGSSRVARAARLITSRANLQTTLDTILQMALEVTGARYGIVRLVDAEGRLGTGSVAGEELDRPLVEALEIAPTTITGWVAWHRQALCIADVACEPWSHLYYPLDRGHEMRAELAVPMLGSGGRLEGVLNLESPRAGAFSDADRLLLQALASHAVIALQEMRLVDALQETAEHLLAWPCGRVLQHLVDLARDLLGVDAAAIHALEGDGRTCLAATATQDPEPEADWEDIREIPVRPPGHGSQVWVLSVYRKRVRRDEHAGPEADSTSPAHDGKATDPASPAQDRAGESEWDAKVGGCLARYAALALENQARQEQLSASRQQRAVAEMFAAVGDVAANLLHQLNNKIGIIPVRVQSVEGKCRPLLETTPYLARQLDEIRRSAQEAMRGVADNLRLLRPSATAAIDLAPCVEQALQMMERPAGLEVTVQGLEALPPVQAEEYSVALVFLNLLDNACTAMQGQGRIRVRGTATLDQVRVTISDTGPGIDPARQEQIFEFSQSGRSGRSGLGFGLWWVRTLLTRIGGSIAVESDGRRGARFRLVFPRSGAAS